MNKYILYITTLILFISALGTSYESPLRYVKYFLFFLFVFKVFTLKTYKVNILLIQNFCLLLIMILFNTLIILLKGNYSTRFIEETTLILLPIVAATGYSTSNIEFLKKSLRIFFYAYATVFIIFNHIQLLELGMLLEKIPIALLRSEFSTESWQGFTFSLFTLYFFLEKKYKHFIVSAIFMILAFKRISIAAIFISISAYFVIFYLLKIKFRENLFRWGLISFNLLLTVFFYFFIDGRFNRVIENFTGLSVNHFTQGRFFVYNRAIQTFKDDIIWGAGLGSTHQYLKIRYPGYDFLHSDFLKIIIEFGILIFPVYLISMVLINIKNAKTFALFLFLNILLLTDNTFIYFDVLFLFYLILVLFVYEDSKA